jgi:3-methyladenine DNA glycosylase/8-oxoguanine DNA glycosylase
VKQQAVHVELDPVDIPSTMDMQLLGRFDPTGRLLPGGFEKVHLDVGGRPLVWRFRRTVSGFSVSVAGGDDGVLDAFVSQFPIDDGAASFAPAHPLLRRLARTFAGLRLFRMPWTFDVAAGAVLQQRVRWRVGYSDFRRIAERWGTRTASGVAFPTGRQLAAVPTYALETAGLDPKRARALNNLAKAEVFRSFLHPGAELGEVHRRLPHIPGIGPWTTNLIAGYAFGDPDAVPVGDLHIPSMVTSALAGEPEGTDARMLALLEPWRGQRFRVIRLMSWASRRAPHILQRTAAV